MRPFLLIPLAVCAVGATLLTGCGGGGSGSGPGFTSGVPLTGDFGGAQSGDAARPASLALSATGGRITLPCGESVQIDGPLTPDSAGQVRASGTDTPAGGPPILPVGTSGHTIPVSLTGSVTGQTLTLTVTAAGTGDALGTYVLVKGRAAPPFTGACPA